MVMTIMINIMVMKTRIMMMMRIMINIVVMMTKDYDDDAIRFSTYLAT